MSKRILAGLVLFAMAVWSTSAGAQQVPSVLFHGGVHACYVVRPLHAMGIEVDSCAAFPGGGDGWRQNARGPAQPAG